LFALYRGSAGRLGVGYEDVVHLRGSPGPPMSLRELSDVLERRQSELNLKALQSTPTGFPWPDANAAGATIVASAVRDSPEDPKGVTCTGGDTTGRNGGSASR